MFNDLKYLIFGVAFFLTAVWSLSLDGSDSVGFWALMVLGSVYTAAGHVRDDLRKEIRDA